MHKPMQVCTHSHAHLCAQPQIYTGMLCPLFLKSVLWENSILELLTYFCIASELFTNSAENMFLLLPSLLSVPSAIWSPVLYTALSRWCLALVTWKCCASVGFYGNVWGSSMGVLCMDLIWPTPWQRAFSFWGAASKLWCWEKNPKYPFYGPLDAGTCSPVWFGRILYA